MLRCCSWNCKCGFLRVAPPDCHTPVSSLTARCPRGPGVHLMDSRVAAPHALPRTAFRFHALVNKSALRSEAVQTCHGAGHAGIRTDSEHRAGAAAAPTSPDR